MDSESLSSALVAVPEEAEAPAPAAERDERRLGPPASPAPFSAAWTEELADWRLASALPSAASVEVSER